MPYIVIFIVILLDQLTKLLVLKHFSDGSFVSLTSFFNLILAYNPGISFSLFANNGPYNSLLLTTMALLICLFLLRWMHKENNPTLRFGIALVIGGAIGNVIDRISYGAVVDFLDFHAYGYHWPAFNVADTAICMGAALILYKSFFNQKGKYHA